MISPFVVGETSQDYENDHQWQSNTRRSQNHHDCYCIWEERNTYSEWNIWWDNKHSFVLSVMFLGSHWQIMTPTKWFNLEMNRRPIQAPTKCANHQESLIKRQSIEVFQDHSSLFCVSIHNWNTSQTSDSIKYTKKCFNKVNFRDFTYH